MTYSAEASSTSNCASSINYALRYQRLTPANAVVVRLIIIQIVVITQIRQAIGIRVVTRVALVLVIVIIVSSFLWFTYLLCRATRPPMKLQVLGFRPSAALRLSRNHTVELRSNVLSPRKAVKTHSMFSLPAVEGQLDLISQLLFKVGSWIVEINQVVPKH